MYEITIRSRPLLFDAEDADEYAKLETAVHRMGQTEQELLKQKQNKEFPYSAVLSGYCNMYRTFFDDVFGKGTADLLFDGEKNKPSVFEEAYLEFLQGLMMQRVAIADKKASRWKQYTVRKNVPYEKSAV